MLNTDATGRFFTRSDESRQQSGQNGAIRWDLDGVLRDLCAGISGHLGGHFDPVSWTQEVEPGVNLCRYIDQHPEVLLAAPATEYLPVCCQENRPIILTCQPEHWKPLTTTWINQRIPGATVVWVRNIVEKMAYLNDGDLLIEDYPGFENNERIILIDRPYNRMVEGCVARITTPDELKEFLKGGNHEHTQDTMERRRS